MISLSSACKWAYILLLANLIPYTPLSAQMQSVVLGQGDNDDFVVTSSSETVVGQASNTLNRSGWLPNLNASSRFLSQSSLGHNLNDLQNVSSVGIEDWIDAQIAMPKGFNMLDKIAAYHQYRRDSLNNPTAGPSIRFYDYAWWQYHMTSDDVLRQRVAFALTEFFVISRFSDFGFNPYPFASFYDIMLDNAFGNYRDILDDVTYSPAMGVYLTYVNNPKSDTILGRFPDENYAREVMQLFSIGLFMLNNDGTRILDANNNPIPTYGNYEIAEFAKIFTGLSWQDRPNFYYGPPSDTSYTLPLKMFNDYHEPGVKNLLNNFQVPDRNPVDGHADIQDALDNLFNHQNVGPFLGKFLIQRLVTSNPSSAYIDRVASAFNDNGSGVRGDLAAVVKAVLLDDEARACEMAEDDTYGKLREPFIRYVQLNKAFNASTLSGDYRNDMDRVQRAVEQKPHTSPSVFNFFQPDHQPIGPIEQEGLVAPEFQITNTQSITGYINGLYEWIIDDNPADEYQLFSGESYDGYQDEISTLNFLDESALADDAQLHILLDRLNLILAQGRVSDNVLASIAETLKVFDDETTEDLEFRARLAAYFIMASPEYLINR